MRITPGWKQILALALAASVPAPIIAQQTVTALTGSYRYGQVFLTWEEPSLGADDTLIVFRSRSAISNLASPECIPLVRLWPGSGRDVFRNDRAGYVIQDGGARITADGLLVHTVYPGEEGSMHYAVAIKPAGGALAPILVPGQNVLSAPVTGQKVEPIQPIWQLAASGRPAAGASLGKPIHLNLHPKQLAVPNQAVGYLAFPDSSMGWQEGVPFKFDVSLQSSHCSLLPLDATFVRRVIQLDADNRSNLIWSWWYGYNDKIASPGGMAGRGKVVNYTERRVLWMIRWAQAYLKTDIYRTYISGGSMAGGGGFSLGMHHPDVFAAIRSWVPNLLYNSRNEYRLVPYTGPLTTPTHEGMSVSDRMNGPLLLARSKALSLPFLVVSSGRNDPSMPWENIPAAFQALDAGRHAFVAAWNTGDHATASTGLAKDIAFWNNLENFHSRFALNKSYLAFSNSSANQDPGSGAAASGDPVGFMNRNLDWSAPVESAAWYDVLIKPFSATLVPPPITMDVTVRRPQRFLHAPGTVLRATNLEAGSKAIQQIQIVVDNLGLITFPGFRMTSAAGNRMILEGPPAGVANPLQRNRSEARRKGWERLRMHDIRGVRLR